jgi:hypothetical protein
MKKKINKPTLIIVGAASNIWSFSYNTYWSDTVSRYFNFEHYQKNKTYEKDTTFLIMAWSYLDPDIRKSFKDKKVIVDLTVEGKYASWGEVFDNKEPHHLVLYGSYSEHKEPGAVFCPNFFWYNTSLANIARGYHRYTPNRNYSKKFLMPIGGKRAWRDHVVETLEPFLNDAYWSYVRRNKALPGDQVTKRYDVLFQNPMWYDDTCFSLVLESLTSQRITHESPIFLTEKIFKPISGQQPFMVVSAAGTLKFLSSQGFETYDNIFNEQYDVETDFDKKMNIIVENITNYKKVPHDNVTLQKIAHNFNRFYDVAVITSGVEKEIVNPIYEYMSNSLI